MHLQVPPNLLYKPHHISKIFSPLILQLSLPDLLKPRVKSRMKFQLERRHVMLQKHMGDQQYYCVLRSVSL